MLTERDARAAKPKEKDYVICDSKGLYLRVATTGRKTWLYRKQKKGGPASITRLGVYPEMSLYAARVARDALAGAKKREAAGVVTFRELSEKYLTEVTRRTCSDRQIHRTEIRLDKYILPCIGEKLVSDLTSPMIYEVVKTVIALKHAELSHRLVGLIGQILRYGIPLGYCPQGDITRDLRGSLPPIKTKSRAHVETRSEVAQLIRRIKGMPAGFIRAALLLQAYTMVRPGELRAARWDEIDIAGATWRIPAEKMKMRKPHIVPLSRQVIELLEYLKNGYSHDSPLVLHALRSVTRPLSDSTLLSAIRDLGYSAEQMSVHGFRAVASTLLNESGWPPDAIEAQLSHVAGGVRAVYNYAQYLPIRKIMIQWYADLLDALAAGDPIPEKPKIEF